MNCSIAMAHAASTMTLSQEKFPIAMIIKLTCAAAVVVENRIPPNGFWWEPLESSCRATTIGFVALISTSMSQSLDGTQLASSWGCRYRPPVRRDVCDAQRSKEKDWVYYRTWHVTTVLIDLVKLWRWLCHDVAETGAASIDWKVPQSITLWAAIPLERSKPEANLTISQPNY